VSPRALILIVYQDLPEKGKRLWLIIDEEEAKTSLGEVNFGPRGILSFIARRERPLSRNALRERTEARCRQAQAQVDAHFATASTNTPTSALQR
jgi:hypothetical protein